MGPTWWLLRPWCRHADGLDHDELMQDPACWDQLADVAALARRFPKVTIVVDLGLGRIVALYCSSFTSYQIS
jgi:hypothetical protein